MIVDHPLVRDLLKPGNLPEPPLDFVSTHASFVFLCRDSVYKVKRAKDYGFFDYSTLEKRKHFCEREVQLNRRTAPDVYLGVLPVHLDAAGYSLTRSGEIVDYAVHMRRLPDDRNVLSHLLRGRLTHAELDEVARVVAGFVRRSKPGPSAIEALRRIIRENFKQVEPYVGRFIAKDAFDETRDAQEAWLVAQDARLRTRAARDVHGDLRLEHVYLMPAGPTIIDCIEFSDAFRILDPALDIAFFSAELARFGRPDLAEYFIARYAYESDDYDLYPLIDGYVSYRAWVRGKVACFLAADPKVDAATARTKTEEAAAFFDLARRTMARPKKALRVAAIAGLIGTGKTVLAEKVSRTSATAVVSADATRKFMADLDHEALGDDRLYDPKFTEQVQSEVLRRAEQVLISGRSVVLDSTFRTRAFRAQARALAGSRGASFLLVECRVPDEIVRRRLRTRTGGVSDARESLFDAFKSSFEPITELPPSEHLVLDTTNPVDPLPSPLTTL